MVESGQFPADGDSFQSSVTSVDRNFRDVLRKRVAPLAFLAAVGLLAAETCRVEAARITVRVELGEAASRVDRLRIDYFFEGDPIDAFVERELGAAPVTSFEHELQIPAGLYEARVRARTGGETRQLSRRFQAGGAATVVLDLADDLLP